MLMYSSEERRLAYTAGFIEADGCFHFQQSVSIRITNKNLAILELFKSWWGGSIRSKGTPKDCYDWNIHSDSAVRLTEKLLPFLNMKNDEANILMEFQSTVGSRGKRVPENILTRRKELLSEMKEVRKKRNNNQSTEGEK